MSNDLDLIFVYLREAVAKRADGHEVKRRDDTIFWRERQNSWCTAGKLSVQFEQYGCYRFNNALEISFPKSVWPFTPPSLDDIGIMNLVVHLTEVKELAPLLVEIATDAIREEYMSPNFRGGIVKPSSCYSLRAEEAYRRRAD